MAPALPGALGYLYLPAPAVLSLASVSMAPLGARTAQGMSVSHLKRIFAMLLYGLASYMLYRVLND